MNIEEYLEAKGEEPTRRDVRKIEEAIEANTARTMLITEVIYPKVKEAEVIKKPEHPKEIREILYGVAYRYPEGNFWNDSGFFTKEGAIEKANECKDKGYNSINIFKVELTRYE